MQQISFTWLFFNLMLYIWLYCLERKSFIVKVLLQTIIMVSLQELITIPYRNTVQSISANNIGKLRVTFLFFFSSGTNCSSQLRFSQCSCCKHISPIFSARTVTIMLHYNYIRTRSTVMVALSFDAPIYLFFFPPFKYTCYAKKCYIALVSSVFIVDSF